MSGSLGPSIIGGGDERGATTRLDRQPDRSHVPVAGPAVGIVRVPMQGGERALLSPTDRPRGWRASSSSSVARPRRRSRHVARRCRVRGMRSGPFQLANPVHTLTECPGATLDAAVRPRSGDVSVIRDRAPFFGSAPSGAVRVQRHSNAPRFQPAKSDCENLVGIELLPIVPCANHPERPK